MNVLAALLVTSACSSEARNNNVLADTLSATEVSQNEDPMKTTDKHAATGDTTRTIKVEWPNPKVELPEISYDKSKLSKVEELDQMLTDAEIVRVASEQFDDMFRELKDANQYGSLTSDGTTEGRLRVINTISDSFKKFNTTGKVLGEKIIAFVKDRYNSDSDFSSKYRETYYAAEEQAKEMILNNELRRKVGSELSNFYKAGASVSLYFVESKLNEALELKSSVISSLLSGVSTDMLISDYKKGKELTDLLSNTTNVLNAMVVLEPSEIDMVSIGEMKNKVAETKKKRVAEIAKAREAYVFPARYSGGNSPANAAELEKRMESFLESFTYNGKDKYDVRKIVVAGPWVEVRSAMGATLYYQIDFYIATKYESTEAGLVEVNLVTGKTSGPNMKTFGTYSIGSVGEMLEENLK